MLIRNWCGPVVVNLGSPTIPKVDVATMVMGAILLDDYVASVRHFIIDKREATKSGKKMKNNA